ncbi:molecular chaperone DnaJ [Leptospira hartskeerlii]|uniref:Molecular chaperone DnaJ n=1 Tax=Leptospira hartskeerlii TaxID=2023177 RepID=A0A2M9XGN1_9LEPT|nr:J domain-containing protein [Leptospira hartskeerlii]PJZ26837.1 molecular chaperone DnaJ [Leptospira hartskeerlii]PJZ34681.1 molecular chaperone DnaJ [Leptospira hartskeerlii]
MSSAWTDHYRVLGLGFGASQESIKHRYRELAKIFHPDNRLTGSKPVFLKVLESYQILSKPEERSRFDQEFKIRKRQEHAKNGIHLIPPSRILFATQAVEFARRGLLRAGMRSRDRKKYTGIYHDIRICLKPEELLGRIFAAIPLVVRTMCPECRGSDLNCASCGGKGSYKSYRYLKWSPEPGTLIPGRIYTLDLSGFRPDVFTHFKKRILKVKIELFQGQKK